MTTWTDWSRWPQNVVKDNEDNSLTCTDCRRPWSTGTGRGGDREEGVNNRELTSESETTRSVYTRPSDPKGLLLFRLLVNHMLSCPARCPVFMSRLRSMRRISGMLFIEGVNPCYPAKFISTLGFLCFVIEHVVLRRGYFMVMTSYCNHCEFDGLVPDSNSTNY